jgi:hypothetical protein
LKVGYEGRKKQNSGGTNWENDQEWRDAMLLGQGV